MEWYLLIDLRTLEMSYAVLVVMNMNMLGFSEIQRHER